MSTFFDTNKIDDTYFLAISEGRLILLVIVTLLAVGAFAWLANRPQPVPHADHWRWIDDRTNWKKTVR